MANLTVTDVEAAMGAAPSIGDRLVLLVSLRKRAIREKQTALNNSVAGTITDAECEVIQGQAQSVAALINNHRTGIEALIQ